MVNVTIESGFIDNVKVCKIYHIFLPCEVLIMRVEDATKSIIKTARLVLMTAGN